MPVVVMQHQHPQRQRRRLQPHRVGLDWPTLSRLPDESAIREPCTYRLCLSQERWPWSLTPREDARVPAPHEVPKTAYASPVSTLTDSSLNPAHCAVPSDLAFLLQVILRLGVRTATLVRDNQELQRRLAVLRAETHAVLSALKRAGRPPASSPSPPPSSPASSSSSASSPWSSPPPSPGSACQYSPASPDSGCDNDFVDSEPGSPDSRA